MRESGGRGRLALWTPAQFSATDMRLWLASDDPAIVLVGSDVDQWPDKSGNGNGLVVAAAANRPLFTASGGANNAPYVEADGASEYMRKLAMAGGGTWGALGIFIVGRGITFGSGDRWLDYGGGVWVAQDGAGASKWTSGRTVLSLSTTNTNGADLMWLLNWDGANNTLYKGTTQEDTDANATAAGADSQALGVFGTSGGAATKNLRLYEVIVLRRAFTAGEITELGAYATRRYGAVT